MHEKMPVDDRLWPFIARVSYRQAGFCYAVSFGCSMACLQWLLFICPCYAFLHTVAFLLIYMAYGNTCAKLYPVRRNC